MHLCKSKRISWNFSSEYHSALNTLEKSRDIVIRQADKGGSVANIFLDKWESEDIFTDEWPQLMLYWRYIDDLFFIWEGSLEDLHSFMAHRNKNRCSIKITSTWSVEEIQYLDLEIFK